MKEQTKLSNVSKQVMSLITEKYELQTMMGRGSGIATGSCWAGLPVYPNVNTGFMPEEQVVVSNPVGTSSGIKLPFSMTYGNSQMSTIGKYVPIPGAPEKWSGHAERNALLIGAENGLVPYLVDGEVLLFVQLAPCGGCEKWLSGTGGGIPNPYLGYFSDKTVNVVYQWEYSDAGIKEMQEWNRLPRSVKLTEIERI